MCLLFVKQPQIDQFDTNKCCTLSYISMRSRIRHPDPVKKRIMENAYHKDLIKRARTTLASSPDLICHTEVGQM